ncbi:MAG TPA: NAD-dependent epimerase/dehydratase family protein [Pyrinomonadaceae bacterium]|jgi:nucleoside-diphosphate-sugar epimerase
MSSLQGKGVLVTGAAGFVGANLARELDRRGALVHALVRQETDCWRLAGISERLKLYKVDLTDSVELQTIVSLIRPEIIFHAAVQRAESSAQARRETLEANIIGTFNLLEATAAHDYERFVHLGSSMEYGHHESSLKETSCLEPVLFFSATKAASTLLCQQAARAGRPIVTLRLFSVYGYWESPQRLVPTAIMAALYNRELSLTARGYRRDFIFIEDVLQACLLAAETQGAVSQIINIGSGKQWTNEELIRLVESVTGRQIKLCEDSYPARASDTTHWVADIDKAHEVLGWEPAHSLEAGLKKTCDWLKGQQEFYKHAAASLKK